MSSNDCPLSSVWGENPARAMVPDHRNSGCETRQKETRGGEWFKLGIGTNQLCIYLHPYRRFPLEKGRPLTEIPLLGRRRGVGVPSKHGRRTNAILFGHCRGSERQPIKDCHCLLKGTVLTIIPTSERCGRSPIFPLDRALLISSAL